MKRNQKSVSFGPSIDFVKSDDATNNTKSEIKPPPLYPPLNRSWPETPKDSETLYLVEVYNDICTNTRILAEFNDFEHKTENLAYPNNYIKFEKERLFESILPEELRNEKSAMAQLRKKICYNKKSTTINVKKSTKDESSFALIEERLKELEELETGQIDKQQDKILANNLSIKQLIDEDDLEIDPNFDFDDEELDEGTDYANNFFDNGEDNDDIDDDADNNEGFY